MHACKALNTLLRTQQYSEHSLLALHDYNVKILYKILRKTRRKLATSVAMASAVTM